MAAAGCHSYSLAENRGTVAEEDGKVAGSFATARSTDGISHADRSREDGGLEEYTSCRRASASYRCTRAAPSRLQETHTGPCCLPLRPRHTPSFVPHTATRRRGYRAS